MTRTLVTYAAVIVAVTCLLVAFVAIRAARLMKALVLRTRAELVTVLEQIAAAQAVEDRLRQQIAEQIARRGDDVETFRVQVQELRENYDRVLRSYQETHGIDGPLLSRRVQ